MRINEIVTKFPKKYRKSNILGKTSDGKHNVVRDEITGLPIVTNKHGVSFEVNPDTFELSSDYDEDYKHPKEWYVAKKGTNSVFSIHYSYEDADLAARKLRQWHGEDVEVISF